MYKRIKKLLAVDTVILYVITHFEFVVVRSRNLVINRVVFRVFDKADIDN